jgi:ketosteroid isomerase-like protein
MKTILIAVLTGMLAWAAAADVATDPSGDREADHAALRTLRDQAVDAINRQDFARLRECLNAPFVFTTIDQTVLTSPEEITAYYDRIFRQGKYPIAKMTIDVEADIPTRFLGPDIGYCHGSAKNRYELLNGMKVTIDSRWSALVSRHEGTWKVDMIHASVNFLDNPVIAMIQQRDQAALYGFGVLAILCLAAAGWFFLRLRRAGRRP